MITVISPAKTLDFETPSTTEVATTPDFLTDAAILIQRLRRYNPKQLMKLMDISKDLAELNVERYLAFEEEMGANRSKQAILAFDGDVYQGMQATDFQPADLEFAQEHLRILSGLYGLLRPLDMIQPHRLEMGTRMNVGRRKNLYDFWAGRITARLNESMMAIGTDTLLNLASQEYFASVRPEELKGRVITPIFLDRKGADYKVVSYWAKKARGKMAAWIIHQRIEQAAAVQEFDLWGYQFNPERSTALQWAFTRETPQP